ncbi:MAG TPA: type II secretion system F family protein, partial [Oscillospiraceae bacterium]|nr:type II secretion system F family protein [Oscillospiraceae bacterium]
FESMFCSILYVGEESGALDDILVKTSDYYEEESDSAITRLVGLLEPVLIIFLGALVGLVIASILPAMYTMMQGIS